MLTVYGLSDSGNCYKVRLALYAYTHCAAEDGFDLKTYPAVGAWLGRVAAQPRHVSMRDQ